MVNDVIGKVARSNSQRLLLVIRPVQSRCSSRPRRASAEISRGCFRALSVEMESFGRRDFVRWPGAKSEAVQVPRAFCDAVQGAKDQAETIAVQELDPTARLSFPLRQRRNPRRIFLSCSGVLLAGTKNPGRQTVSISTDKALGSGLITSS
jgi:hypothetical protein